MPVSAPTDPQAELIALAGECTHDPLRWVKAAYDWGHGELAAFDGPRQWQADAYREQRLGLARYFRTTTGDPETATQIESDTDWPMRPYVPAQQELIA